MYNVLTRCIFRQMTTTNTPVTITFTRDHVGEDPGFPIARVRKPYSCQIFLKIPMKLKQISRSTKYQNISIFQYYIWYIEFYQLSNTMQWCYKMIYHCNGFDNDFILYFTGVPFEFPHNTQSWQHWHLIQMHQNI